MKEYRRLVSYLYEYKNQQKGKNAGFIRMELRDPRCRIRVCINGSGGDGRQIGSVLLIRVRETDTEEIPLGTIMVSNGSGETSFQTQADHMGGSPYPWEDFAGIRIMLAEPEQNFYTYWDDRVEDMGRSGIGQSQPMPAARVSEEETAETAAEPEEMEAKEIEAEEIGAEEVPEPENEVELVEPESPEWAEKTVEAEEAVAEELFDQPEEVAGAEASPEPEEPVEAEASPELEESVEAGAFPESEEPAEAEASTEPEAGPEPFTMPENFEDMESYQNDKEYIEWNIPVEEVPDLDRELRMEEQASEQGHWFHSRPEPQPWPEEPRITWRQLSNMYPKYLPFDGEEDWEILRLSLQDIGRLPRDYWHLGTNDFVVHGFYDHRHLILVRDSQSGSCYLGVPGAALEQDRRVAELFGFRKYHPAGEFGYWLTGIKL